MVERLGNVLYWLGCILAGLTVLVGTGMFWRNGGVEVFLIVCFAALIIWVIGLALRYVLRG